MEIRALQLSEKNSLFADYLENSEKARAFYPYHFRDDWQNALAGRGGFETPWREMAEILLAQNRRWGASEETLNNIRRLNSPQTLAVVTGQQAGALGGPLYTFYKTITVLKLAGQLAREFPDYTFVPVFWMEVNDSDFQEIGAVQYLSKENELRRLVLQESPEEAQQPVFARRLDGQIQQWRQTLEQDFFDTEFKTAALDLFLGCYAPGQGYADAFAALMQHFFGKYGLILFNPAEAAVSALASSLFTKSLTSAPEILKIFAERSNALESAGYAPQIQLGDRQTLLFFTDERKRRVRIDFDENGGFVLKYPDGYQSLAREVLLKKCAETPGTFSPNVALRPLMQDLLLPGAAYVAGPAETAYFAQIEALYGHFRIPMPVIYPRHRLTIAEGKVHKNVQKFNLAYEEILAGRPDFSAEFLRRSAGQGLNQSLQSAGERIRQALAELQQEIAAADPTLVNTLEKTRQSIEDSFGKLGGKITRSLEERNQAQVRQLEKVLLHLLPGNQPQERVLNMLYFCIKYGMDFVDRLLTLLPEDSERQYLVSL